MENFFIFLLFMSVVCGVFALGEYIADNFLQDPPENT